MSGQRQGLSRTALWIMGAGMTATALAVVGFSAGEIDLDLDRFDFAKELCFFATAIPAFVILLARSPTCGGDLDLGRSALAWWGVALLGAISALVALNPWCAWRGVGLSVASAAAFAVARHLGRAQPLRDRLLCLLVTAASVACLTVLLEAYGVIPGLSVAGRMPAGTLGVRNYAGHVAVLALPALALAFLQARFFVWLIALLGGSIVLSATLVLTRSRAAYLAFFVMSALVVMAALWLRNHDWTALRLRVVAFVLALLVGAIGAITLPNKLAWRSSSPYLDTLKGISNYEAGTGKGRLSQYGFSLAMARSYPLLGVGPGNWFLRYGEFADEGVTYHPDSVWPTPIRATSDLTGFAAERGVASLLLFAWGLFALVAAAFTRLRLAESARAALPAITMLLSAAGLVIVALLDCVLQLPFPSFLVFVLWGLLSSDVAPPVTLALKSPVRAGAAVVLALVCLALVWISGRETLAVVRASRARTAEEWSRAAATSPGNHRMYLRAAWAAGHENCQLTRDHARRALTLYPGYRQAERLYDLCPPPPAPRTH